MSERGCMVRQLPMELAVEARELIAIYLEGSEL